MAKTQGKIDLSSYLNVNMDDVPDFVPSLPGGHFIARIQGWSGAERNYNKATGGPPVPVAELTFKIISACDDVEDPDNISVGKTATKDYTLNDPDGAGVVALKRVATVACGLDIKGMELTDVLEALKGEEVKIFNAPRPGKEEGQFYSNITRVLPAND